MNISVTLRKPEDPRWTGMRLVGSISCGNVAITVDEVPPEKDLESPETLREIMREVADGIEAALKDPKKVHFHFLSKKRP